MEVGRIEIRIEPNVSKTQLKFELTIYEGKDTETYESGVNHKHILLTGKSIIHEGAKPTIGRVLVEIAKLIKES